MTVLAALLMCLLFHTATLEEDLAPEGTPQTSSPAPPEPSQSPDPVANPETTGTSAGEGEKIESHLIVKPHPNVEEKTDSTQAESKKASNPKKSAEGPVKCPHTRWSCSKVFCPPWRRCISGQCVCKMPYKCPRQDKQACTLDGSHYYSMCQTKAISCRSSKPVFSHFSSACTEEHTVEVELRKSKKHNVVMIKTEKGTMPVCGNGWNMASANVVCRNPGKESRGADAAPTTKYSHLDNASDWGKECMSVRCTGSELSLAECTIYHPMEITESSDVAAVKCHEPKEKNKPTEINQTLLFSDPMSEIRAIRKLTESQLQCGVPNMEYEFKAEDAATLRRRRKRLVGGEEALPTQIQWQVAIQDEGSIHCGGAYLGGCWVLTAAHCVRPKPKSYRIKFSLWKKHRKQSTTDSIPVKNIIIHHEYDAQTYANDIALVQLEPLNLSDKCMVDNPAVRSVCVPWSTEQFQPNDTCTISGWGRDKEGQSAAILKWANVTIIGDCNNYYKDRFLPGMECAGDLEGKVDSCQGDSGGPLVCKDASGVSYVWGIVSWGEKCGEPNNPGVYTKVAHYFDWIRLHTGWAAVTKYNQ
ncbi:complement factor I isoform X2 [Pimephales promelas]|uniref:complement factor I isoform X2 n=1 Tax=Pimephales promelas TaxID=90988 RepID=UPI001955BBBF|nr:complement factor I isoform X2 [Pimephales promelas]